VQRCMDHGDGEQLDAILTEVNTHVLKLIQVFL
jgi:hypothetical protein